MKNPYKDKSDDELVFHAGQFPGDTGNQAELTRRLMNSIRSLDKSTARYSSALIALTLLLIVLGFLQLVLTVFVTPLAIVTKFSVGALILIVILYAGRNIVKSFLE